MRLFALICVTMCAFAANSVLTRAGIDQFGMDAYGFAGVRLLAGTAMLALLVSLRRGAFPAITSKRQWSGVMLAVYLVPFSLAYLSLPAGIGALILFGVVQITMFSVSAYLGVRPSGQQWVGMGIAMAGLVWLLWPSEALALPLLGVVFMVISGIGWGMFSLGGRGSEDPLGDMAISFILLAPLAVVMFFFGDHWSVKGVISGILCGAVTSALGYALWYTVLPRIAATTAAVAQLSVPVIAIIAGAVLLSEPVTLDVVLASAVVLGGIAVAVVRRA